MDAPTPGRHFPLTAARTVLSQTRPTQPPAVRPVDAIRMLRSSLRAEERQVSYWRRLVQGRLDLIGAGQAGKPASLDSLAGRGPVLAGERPPAVAGLPGRLGGNPLRDAERLWQRPVPWDDEAGLARLRRRLGALETELSGYRRLLHERIDACTGELIDRYRRDLGQVPGLAAPTDVDDEAACHPPW
jgi:hypothetical protein